MKFLILRLLENQELSGQEVRQTLHERSSGLWRPSPGSVYPILDELVRTGEIEQVSIKGRIKRYRTSDAGRAFLREIVDRRSTAVKSRARTGPRFWLYLLDCRDRTSLRLENIHSDLIGLEEDVAGLEEEDRTRVVKELEQIARQLSTLIDRLRKGDMIEHTETEK